MLSTTKANLLTHAKIVYLEQVIDIIIDQSKSYVASHANSKATVL